jgi:hypothetical protein
MFGIELKAGVPVAVAGVGVDHLRGWQHEVRVRLADTMVSLPLIFLDSETAPRILGREGIFDRYHHL